MCATQQVDAPAKGIDLALKPTQENRLAVAAGTAKDHVAGRAPTVFDVGEHAHQRPLLGFAAGEIRRQHTPTGNERIHAGPDHARKVTRWLDCLPERRRSLASQRVASLSCSRHEPFDVRRQRRDWNGDHAVLGGFLDHSGLEHRLDAGHRPLWMIVAMNLGTGVRESCHGCAGRTMNHRHPTAVGQGALNREDDRRIRPRRLDSPSTVASAHPIAVLQRRAQRPVAPQIRRVGFGERPPRAPEVARQMLRPAERPLSQGVRPALHLRHRMADRRRSALFERPKQRLPDRLPPLVRRESADAQLRVAREARDAEVAQSAPGVAQSAANQREWKVRLSMQRAQQTSGIRREVLALVDEN